MRVITIRQPWAWAIFFGGKDVENRSKNIIGDYRGPLAVSTSAKIHSVSWDGFQLRAPINLPFDNPRDADLIYGHIIGVVDLVDVHECNTEEGFCLDANNSAPCSPWAWPDAKFHIQLSNPRPILPISFRGALGTREVSDPRILAHIHAALTK